MSSAAPGNAFKFIRTNTLAKNRLLLAAMTNKQSYDDGSISDNEIKINLEGKFVTERGRINCSLRENTGEWRWLGIQFVISDL